MMTYKQQKGFTLIEMMIVIALLAIIASIATPSMMHLIQKNQVRQEMRDFVSVLNEARTEAVLKRKTVSLGGTAGSNMIVHDKWQPKNNQLVDWEVKPDDNTPIAFNFMGRVNIRAGRPFECFILRHKNDANVKAVVVLYPQGTIEYKQSATSCPT